MKKIIVNAIYTAKVLVAILMHKTNVIVWRAKAKIALIRYCNDKHFNKEVQEEFKRFYNELCGYCKRGEDGIVRYDFMNLINYLDGTTPIEY